MDLSQPVAVIGGKIFPLDEYEVNREVSHQPIRSSTDSTSTFMKDTNIVTGESITGSVRTNRGIEVGDRPEETEIYLFPEEGGTRERIQLTGAYITGTVLSIRDGTQEIEFIAKEVHL